MGLNRRPKFPAEAGGGNQTNPESIQQREQRQTYRQIRSVTVPVGTD